MKSFIIKIEGSEMSDTKQGEEKFVVERRPLIPDKTSWELSTIVLQLALVFVDVLR